MSLNQTRPGQGTAGPLVVFIVLAILVLVLAACTGAQPGAVQPFAPTQAAAAAAKQPSAVATQAPTTARPQLLLTPPVGNLTRSGEAGAVMVDITPLNLGAAGTDTIDFEVAMNTHSVELGVDLAKLAVLKTGENEVVAEAWHVPAGGGHHVAGTLSFPRMTAASKPVLAGAASVTVVIHDLAGVPEREFSWNAGPDW